MNDLISRKGAIDAVYKCTDIFAGDMPVMVVKADAYEALAQLPSAESEIVRCKDCKYWMPHSQLGYDEDNETYHDYCERLIPEDEYYAFYKDADDYCSRAERRTDETD